MKFFLCETTLYNHFMQESKLQKKKTKKTNVYMVRNLINMKKSGKLDLWSSSHETNTVSLSWAISDARARQVKTNNIHGSHLANTHPSRLQLTSDGYGHISTNPTLFSPTLYFYLKTSDVAHLSLRKFIRN